jgi:hypothetical protein
MRKSLLLLTCAALAACQTTGDPNQGGLFGWSEKKADARIAEREDTLGREQETARSEQEHEAALRHEARSNAQDLEAQHEEISQLLANAEALEHEAPTPAALSRAHRLREAIDSVRRDKSMTVEERWRLLRKFSVEVDFLRAEAAGTEVPASR